MVELDTFLDAVKSVLGIDLDDEQEQIVRAPVDQCLWVIAGPGSGKTATLSLRVLKLILVDRVDPGGILATTFTRRGAAELRSRVLGSGNRLMRAFGLEPAQINLNQIITGTLDSIVREVMADLRAPGLPAPVVVEDFVADSLMVRIGLLELGLLNHPDLRSYIASLKGSSYGLNVAEAGRVVREIRERIIHDQVNFDLFRASEGYRPGVEAVCQIIQAYDTTLRRRFLCDYAELERQFLEQLETGALDRFVSRLKYVLVDEYQDTNRLQEKIYLKLAEAAYTAGGGIAVVGDDDQSLFRFRGATVDLFQSFARSLEKHLHVTPQRRYLFKNYRSTETIVKFINAFIRLDPAYQTARIPEKPEIEHHRKRTTEYPILGLFADDEDALAKALARWIHTIVYDRFVLTTPNGDQISIQLHTEGSPGDIAVLCDSPQEYSSGGRERLPLLLRRYLNTANPAIKVFNPRGQDLERVACVARLCGLMLECLDPHGVCQGFVRIPSEVDRVLNSWRAEAQQGLRQSGLPELLQFVTAWQRREPTTARRESTRTEVSLVDLVYKLITWIPEMQDDVEGLVYLEAITRTITQSALISDFQGKVVFEHFRPDAGLGRASVVDALRNVFVPLAAGAVRIEEDLLETLPTDRINIMSIHQAKGLQFPVVIVDVGSDFRTNHHRQAFRRFPHEPGKEHRLEDELRRYADMGAPARPQLDRAFDDLVRRFFVAYSRAQDLLVLVGLNSVKLGTVRHIALGWLRDGRLAWRTAIPYLVEISC